MHLVNGRASDAAIYPEQVCYAILRGLRKQLTQDSNMNINYIGTICEDLDEQRRIQFDLIYVSNPKCVDDFGANLRS